MAIVIIVIAFAACFAYLNGLHDASNIVATMISSRAMTPRRALLLVSAGELIGPFIFGVAVATTLGRDLVAPESITTTVLLSAILWNLGTWYLGLPSSLSHALIGRILGAVISTSGFHGLYASGLVKVGVSLLATPILVMAVGYLAMKLVLVLARNASPKINVFFKRAQVPTATILSLSHGANDAQKTMGVIAMALVISGYQQEFHVSLWIVALSATAISLGTVTGGWRIIKTVRGKFYRIRPVHAFSSQGCSALIILAASLLGGPVSGTHVVSSSIIGVGSAERLSKVKWNVAGNIMAAWLITIPATTMTALVLHRLLNWLLPS